MRTLKLDDIRQIADTSAIFERAERLQRIGAFRMIFEDTPAPDMSRYVYEVDGSFGCYETTITIGDTIETSCDCPYSGIGCKHVVAVLLDLLDQFNYSDLYSLEEHSTEADHPHEHTHDRPEVLTEMLPTKQKTELQTKPADAIPPEITSWQENDVDNGEPHNERSNEILSEHLHPTEIKVLALEDRTKRGRSEQMSITPGDMYKGDHLVTTRKGKQYQVTIHNPETGSGHCSCPDYLSNRLGTCKHLVFVSDYQQSRQDLALSVRREIFPYIDIFWDSISQQVRLFHEMKPGAAHAANADNAAFSLLNDLFDEAGRFRHDEILSLLPFLEQLEEIPRLRIQEAVMEKLEARAMGAELAAAEENCTSLNIADQLTIAPYPYQEEGIRFGLFKKAVLIGDEMGLGKTVQAIGLAVLKKQIFGFTRVLVITMSSLKQQWKREIEKFSREQACIVAGSAAQRSKIYREDASLFKISNYEAVLRDVAVIATMKPDLIILDEAQRIKNFETKTAEAVKSLPRQHAVILTGTPLENKLEDVYSLVQFLDPDLLSPLWQFAADHFLLGRKKKRDILGYTNLHALREKLTPLVIRRRKEEVLDQLPDVIVNDYYIDLHRTQQEIHLGYSQTLLPLINKKFLTPVDIRRIQALLLKMRQVCDSTYLIDRETNTSPKLDELGAILEEVLQQHGRKVVLFTEWTSMAMLIGKELSRRSIQFVALSGKVPVEKRQQLIDEFTTSPECRVFLSTDAGGTGLNLQAADCVINFELPWNPAKLNQRIGRVNRIGQQSQCVNVINLIARDSIEERIMAGIKLKGDLFNGVFEDGKNEVRLTQKSKQEMVEALRKMMEDDEASAPLLDRGFVEDTLEEAGNWTNEQEFPDHSRDLQHIDDANYQNYLGEEMWDDATSETAKHPAHSAAHQSRNEDRAQELQAEKMEAVLNQGMGFLSGLLEMATGEKLTTTETDGRMVTINRETGEVTLKFTLPGFGGQQSRLR